MPLRASPDRRTTSSFYAELSFYERYFSITFTPVEQRRSRASREVHGELRRLSSEIDGADHAIVERLGEDPAARRRVLVEATETTRCFERERLASMERAMRRLIATYRAPELVTIGDLLGDTRMALETEGPGATRSSAEPT